MVKPKLTYPKIPTVGGPSFFTPSEWDVYRPGHSEYYRAVRRDGMIPGEYLSSCSAPSNGVEVELGVWCYIHFTPMGLSLPVSADLMGLFMVKSLDVSDVSQV